MYSFEFLKNIFVTIDGEIHAKCLFLQTLGLDFPPKPRLTTERTVVAPDEASLILSVRIYLTSTPLTAAQSFHSDSFSVQYISTHREGLCWSDPLFNS
jgi:hypothetical protein